MSRDVTTVTCRWPGCQVRVPRARWGCAHHWFLLPEDLRTEIKEALPGYWNSQRRGNFELHLKCARRLQAAHQAALDWIAQRHTLAGATPDIKSVAAGKD